MKMNGEELRETIAREITDFVMTDPSMRLSFAGDYLMWDRPLVKFADGNDPLFTEYKKIIGPAHLTPREALAQAHNKDPRDLPEDITVICWVLPIPEKTRESNRNAKQAPGRLWSHTRWYGEKSNDQLRRHMVEYLTSRGYLAAAPVIQPYFKMLKGENGLSSNWSERHIAYAAGLGTFSLSDGFITERGISHRCGSVVAAGLAIRPDIRTASGPYANCLFHRGVNCRACIKRCPAQAISAGGHDKIKCGQYLEDIGGYSTIVSKGVYDNEKSVAGCGLCQTGVPCEFKNPAQAD